MATITTSAGGNVSDPTKWDLGRIPTAGDTLRIDHAMVLDCDLLAIKNIILRQTASMLTFDDAADRVISFASTGTDYLGSAYAITSASWTGDDGSLFGIVVAQGHLNLSAVTHRLEIKPTTAGQRTYILHVESAVGFVGKPAKLTLNGGTDKADPKLTLTDLGSSTAINVNGVTWGKCAAGDINITFTKFVNHYRALRTAAVVVGPVTFTNNTLIDGVTDDIYNGTPTGNPQFIVTDNTVTNMNALTVGSASNVPSFFFTTYQLGDDSKFQRNFMDFSATDAASTKKKHGAYLSLGAGMRFLADHNTIKQKVNADISAASLVYINGVVGSADISYNRSEYGYKTIFVGGSGGYPENVDVHHNFLLLDWVGRTDSIHVAGAQGEISTYKSKNMKIHHNTLVFDISTFPEKEPSRSHSILGIMAIWDVFGLSVYKNTIVANGPLPAGYTIKGITPGEGTAGQNSMSQCYVRDNICVNLSSAVVLSRGIGFFDAHLYDPAFPTLPGLHHTLAWGGTQTSSPYEITPVGNNWYARSDYTRVDDSAFTVPGDQTSANPSTHGTIDNSRMYPVGRQVRVTLSSGGPGFARVLTSTYSGGVTTVVLDTAIMLSTHTGLAIAPGDTYFDTLSTWSSFGNVVGDPKFRNMGGTSEEDYMLLAGSAAIGAASDGGNIGALGVYTAPGGGGGSTPTTGRIRQVIPKAITPQAIAPQAITPVQ